MKRYLFPQLLQDLKKKMVLLGGPRQVGKTTLAKQLSDKKSYLSWDIASDREKILKRELPAAPLWIFDEIHKYRSWRNYLKGLYDAKSAKQQILVTGSARLDLYRFGGDSLQGRYHYLRLHPLSVAELNLTTTKDFNQLLELGGFPEPFLGGDAVEAKRWSREYRSRLLEEDLTSLESIQDLGNVELLMLHLPELVGSPLSLNALREDLQVAHKTIQRWLGALERLYAIFFLLPLGAPKIRAVKKSKKHYHFDWSIVTDPALRFENLVACHLLKWVHYEQDTKGRDIELRYFRDTDAREVDFVVVERRQPLFFVECKWNDVAITQSLYYLKAKFPLAQAYQISAIGKKDYLSPEGIRVMPALPFLQQWV